VKVPWGMRPNGFDGTTGTAGTGAGGTGTPPPEGAGTEGSGGASGGTGTGAAGAGAGAPPPPAKTYTQAELDAAMSATRDEAAKYRTENKTLKEAADAAAKAKMTDDERKAAELADREKKAADRESAATERLVATALREAGVAAGMAPGTLKLLPRLIERSSVELDDSGEPKNAAALVDAFLKEHPEMKAGAGTGAGSADGGSRGKSTLTLEAIQRMSPAEINQRWDEVSAFLARQ